MCRDRIRTRAIPGDRLMGLLSRHRSQETCRSRHLRGLSTSRIQEAGTPPPHTIRAIGPGSQWSTGGAPGGCPSTTLLQATGPTVVDPWRTRSTGLCQQSCSCFFDTFVRKSGTRCNSLCWIELGQPPATTRRASAGSRRILTGFHTRTPTSASLSIVTSVYRDSSQYQFALHSASSLPALAAPVPGGRRWGLRRR